MEEEEEKQLPELYLDKEVKHLPNGQWPKGTSGNPKGRPKGSKNRLTELQEEAELALRENINPEVLKAVLANLVAEALGGNVQASKYIIDKFMANRKSVEDVQERQNTEYVFVIKDLTEDDLPKEVRGETINQEENSHGEE